MIKTCEFVSPKHPDKQCDIIADSILDAYLRRDKQARVAVEVMGGHGSISVSGEIKSKARVDIKQIVGRIVGKNYHVHQHVVRQSPFIAAGVDGGGAGDQGIMLGYAFAETKNFMPLEYELARNLCQRIYRVYPFDGKVQVTIEMDPRLRGDGNRYKILSVVSSFQNTKTDKLYKLVKKLIKAEEYLINPAGEWILGGFDADSGLSGRKIVVDNYGPEYPVGGGSFSGKDYTKVDRSGAYLARKIAVDLLKKQQADFVKVKLAYAIGQRQPVMATCLRARLPARLASEAERAGKAGKQVLEEIPLPKRYDLTPNGIKKLLRLDRPIYAQTAVWGHFGRGFIWDK